MIVSFDVMVVVTRWIDRLASVEKRRTMIERHEILVFVTLEWDVNVPRTRYEQLKSTKQQQQNIIVIKTIVVFCSFTSHSITNRNDEDDD
jgi:hypothetical protein